MRRLAPLVLIATVAVFVGCSSEPQAPTLYDSPIFHSDEDGFRFLMPDEYKLTSRANFPHGRLEGDKVVVQYQRFGTGKPSSFEVSRRDEWTLENLPTLLAEASHSVQKWIDSGKRETLDLKGTPGEFRSFSAMLGKDKMTKDVVAFRRADRGYFLTMIYRSNDDSARSQFRRLVEGLAWVD